MIDKEFLTFSEKPRELPTVALRGLVPICSFTLRWGERSR